MVEENNNDSNNPNRTLKNEAYLTARPTQYFNLHDGRQFRTIADLIDSLDSMSDETFQHHVGMHHNDFSNWLRYTFYTTPGPPIYGITDKTQMKNLLIAHYSKLNPITSPKPLLPREIDIPSSKDEQLEQTLDLPDGTLKEYAVDGGTLYTWQEAKAEKIRGTLRYNPRSKADMDTVLTTLKRVQSRYPLSGKLPESLDALADSILASKKTPLQISLLSKNNTANEIKFCYTNEITGFIDNYVTAKFRRLSDIANELESSESLKTTGLAIFAGLFSSAAAALVGNLIFPNNPTIGYAAMIPAGVSGFCAVHLPVVICYMYSYALMNPERGISMIRRDLTEISRLKEEQAVTANNKQYLKLQDRINKRYNNIKQLTAVVNEVLSENAISITYEGTQEEVLNFFRHLQGDDSALKAKTIEAEVVSAETKEEQRLVVSNSGAEQSSSLEATVEKEIPAEPKVADTIRITNDWKKDKRYGEKIDGRYELKECIGVGGMCEVYKAVDSRNDSFVALKFQKQGTNSLSKKRSLIKKLLDPKFTNENLIATKDANLDATPEYMVLDYVDGADLGRILDSIKGETPEERKFLSIETALRIAKDTANALRFLHSNGEKQKIIHNDIKPRNIMLDKNGKTYLGDCDIADITDLASSLTSQDASTAGTIDYIAPERRTTNCKIDSRSDIYSLGILTYEMLAGEVPISLTGLKKRKDIPEELIDFVSKCTEPNPTQRYQTIEEAIIALNQIKHNNQKTQIIIEEANKESEQTKEPETKHPEQKQPAQESPEKQPITEQEKTQETTKEETQNEEDAEENPEYREEPKEKELE